MHRNFSTNQRPGNSRNSTKHDQKLIRSKEYNNKCIYQDWDQSLARKCTETQKYDGWTNEQTSQWTNGQSHSYRHTRTYEWESITAPAATTSHDENFSYTLMFNSSLAVITLLIGDILSWIFSILFTTVVPTTCQNMLTISYTYMW